MWKIKHNQLAPTAWLILVLVCALLIIIGRIFHVILLPGHYWQVQICPHLPPAVHLGGTAVPVLTLQGLDD